MNRAESKKQLPSKVNVASGGILDIKVPKRDFDGFDFEFHVRDRAVQQDTLVSTRRFVRASSSPDRVKPGVTPTAPSTDAKANA